MLPKTEGAQDDASLEAPDMLTRQLETYLNLPSVEAARESASGSSKSAMNPMMTAIVIRARMALAGAVPKMLAAAKQTRLASLGSAAPHSNNNQVKLGGHQVQGHACRVGHVEVSRLGAQKSASHACSCSYACLLTCRCAHTSMSVPVAAKTDSGIWRGFAQQHALHCQSSCPCF